MLARRSGIPTFLAALLAVAACARPSAPPAEPKRPSPTLARSVPRFDPEPPLHCPDGPPPPREEQNSRDARPLPIRALYLHEEKRAPGARARRIDLGDHYVDFIVAGDYASSTGIGFGWMDPGDSVPLTLDAEVDERWKAWNALKSARLKAFVEASAYGNELETTTGDRAECARRGMEHARTRADALTDAAKRAAAEIVGSLKHRPARTTSEKYVLATALDALDSLASGNAEALPLYAEVVADTRAPAALRAAAADFAASLTIGKTSDAITYLRVVDQLSDERDRRAYALLKIGQLAKDDREALEALTKAMSLATSGPEGNRWNIACDAAQELSDRTMDDEALQPAIDCANEMAFVYPDDPDALLVAPVLARALVRRDRALPEKATIPMDYAGALGRALADEALDVHDYDRARHAARVGADLAPNSKEAPGLLHLLEDLETDPAVRTAIQERRDGQYGPDSAWFLQRVSELSGVPSPTPPTTVEERVRLLHDSGRTVSIPEVGSVAEKTELQDRASSAVTACARPIGSRTPKSIHLSIDTTGKLPRTTATPDGPIARCIAKQAKRFFRSVGPARIDIDLRNVEMAQSESTR
ncbi:MAG: hypothetical protein HOW73_32660 [Polyangiaceae bacterium]|nr:hypothetical protein [Polyangiaceae bacterium]